MDKMKGFKYEEFMTEYLKFAEKMRPDIAAIEDPEVRDEELSKWMNEMEEPEKLMMDFIQTNPVNISEFTDDMRKKSVDASSQSDKVKHLPLQDTIWMIDDIVTMTADDGSTHLNLAVYDKKDYIIGTIQYNTADVPFNKHCRDLICACALHPMVGQPRRPVYVTLKNPELAEKAVGLDLSDLGVHYMYAGMSKVEGHNEPIRMRECSVCHLRGSKDLFKKCSSCQALLYCSRTCQKKDWSRTGNSAPHSHKLWCKRMKGYMTAADTMNQLPFTFIQETTSDEFDMMAYRGYLERQGVYNQGCWRREICIRGQHTVRFGELPEPEDAIVLPVESTVLDEAPSQSPSQLKDWESYYTYRGFKLDSPIAILLQWPLTLHYILKYCLPNDNPEWWDDLDCSRLVIDILGVEKEVDILPVFKELGYLFPDVSLDIHMYGNEISKVSHNREYVHDNIQVKVIHGLYHKQADTTRKPHVAVGFNAGLAAYQHWSPTIVKLRTDRIPAYFTDYCQYSCECARLAVEGLCLGTISTPVINPFRSPVRKLAEENDMPWYSNGFLYRIIYPS